MSLLNHRSGATIRLKPKMIIFQKYSLDCHQRVLARAWWKDLLFLPSPSINTQLCPWGLSLNYPFLFSFAILSSLALRKLLNMTSFTFLQKITRSMSLGIYTPFPESSTAPNTQHMFSKGKFVGWLKRPLLCRFLKSVSENFPVF